MILQAVLFLSANTLCPTTLVQHRDVEEIYSESSLLTRTALVLNEWTVKLINHIQSFRVAHVTFVSLIHTCESFQSHSSWLLCFHPMQSIIRIWSQLYVSPNHNNNKTRI